MVKANQQIRGDGRQFPKNKQQQNIVARDNAEHRKHEQRKVDMKGKARRMVAHIRKRIELY
ncbi:hypothetical protein VspSTUT11_44940 [Vibrio sp. STUT-A11]|nr:hypothetical protein VspSTUT11_44940 [Vibrio sp. STUT-A11]